MSLRIPRDRLPGPPEGRQFIGADHGGAPVSLFLVAAPHGSGPRLHRHPYPEIFVIDRGQAAFQIDDDHVEASAGDIVIAPAGSAHRFTNTGETELRLTAIHTDTSMTTEWLEP
jgi:mannose-6-phosphate isomerase-like protein (cupin superfamily)